MKNIFQILSHASFEPTEIIIQFISFNWFKNYVSRFPDGEPFILPIINPSGVFCNSLSFSILLDFI